MTDTMHMPDRLVPLMGMLCGFLVISYMALMGATIFYASWQTQSVSSLRTAESNIGNLEFQYYDTINKVSAINPSSLGFVTPTDVEYITGTPHNASNLTYAGN